jgi:hypothetical protein
MGASQLGIVEKVRAIVDELIRTILIQCCRLWISIIVCYGTFVATFGSAVFAPGSKQASREFGVGEEVGLLGTSLFVGHLYRHIRIGLPTLLTWRSSCRYLDSPLGPCCLLRGPNSWADVGLFASECLGAQSSALDPQLRRTSKL